MVVPHGHESHSTFTKEVMDFERWGPLYILPDTHYTVGQGSWGPVQDPDQMLVRYLSMSPPADGDNVTFRLPLGAGTYSILVACIYKNTQGIMKIDIDGVTKLTNDNYRELELFNQFTLQTGIVIPAAGVKEIRLRVDGKHGDSLGHQLSITYIAFWRTA